ncbi:hypothetical protein HKX48_008576 [Thoreauomyces humboldtii]|nr:hypothetical protein HKX48_008576 [Thoreauomyces humboldtii]
MVAIKSLLLATVLSAATLATAAPGASAFALSERDSPETELLSTLYDQYVAQVASTGDADDLFPSTHTLETRGQCPNSMIPKCAGLVAKQDFASVLGQCGNCIKESSLCVEVLPFAKLSRTICRFAKQKLQCSGVRIIGWESGFNCKE